MEQKNFKIYVEDERTKVDLTEEIKKYCQVKNRNFKNVMQYATVLQNHPSVKARSKNSNVQVDEEKAVIVFDTVTKAETAYNISKVFVNWFINSIEGYIISSKVIKMIVDNKEM